MVGMPVRGSKANRARNVKEGALREQMVLYPPYVSTLAVAGRCEYIGL